MRAMLKRWCLVVARALGLFELARLMTGKQLRILCYHGFALEDEDGFRPGMFTTAATLEQRLKTLAAHRFPVLRLAEALDRLRDGTLPRGATVITIDDGFYSVYKVARPRLRAMGYPATVYVTTYYAGKGSPIFRLAVRYMFWRTPLRAVELRGYSWAQDQALDLTDRNAAERLASEIIDYGESRGGEDVRRAIARELGELLHVDYGRIEASRILSLMNVEELREARNSGLDIQLHTHRHRLAGNSRDALRQEVLQNRAWLEERLGGVFLHLCYPSGEWSEHQLPWLQQLAIDSATTCEPGLNYAHTPRLALRRFLDGEDIDQIVFEAEMFGFLEVLRKIRRALAWVRSGAFLTSAVPTAHPPGFE